MIDRYGNVQRLKNVLMLTAKKLIAYYRIFLLTFSSLTNSS